MKSFSRVIGTATALAFIAVSGTASFAANAKQVIEVVTFKLKPGVTPAEFQPIDKAVGVQHVAKQPGFISRESAADKDGGWLVIVHWKSVKDADASMASFTSAHAAAAFMSKLQADTMKMVRYDKQ